MCRRFISRLRAQDSAILMTPSRRLIKPGWIATPRWRRSTPSRASSRSEATRAIARSSIESRFRAREWEYREAVGRVLFSGPASRRRQRLQAAGVILGERRVCRPNRVEMRDDRGKVLPGDHRIELIVRDAGVDAVADAAKARGDAR